MDVEYVEINSCIELVVENLLIPFVCRFEQVLAKTFIPQPRKQGLLRTKSSRKPLPTA